MPTEPIQPDQIIISSFPAPPDYPFEPSPDEFSPQPRGETLAHRRQELFNYILKNPAPTSPKAPWFEIARLAAGGAPHTGILHASLDYIDARKDSADFCIHAILRLLYQFPGHPQISPDLYQRAQNSILNFKYWPDEPGLDAMCTWTESHYILFSSAAFLAGQLFPTETFSNSNQSGNQKLLAHRKRIMQWLNLRYFTGFSEWLSHVHYDEDLTALINLADFAQDDEIRKRAEIIIDLLLFEIAVHTFRGVFGSTHGRSYEASNKWASLESTSPTQKLILGSGVYSQDNMSAIALALSQNYRVPLVITKISEDQDRMEMVHRQRIGIQINQAKWWGIQTNNFEDGMQLLSLDAYYHPRVVNLFVRMLDAFDWWNNGYFKPFQERKRLIKLLYHLRLLSGFSRRRQHDLCRSAREEVNVYTYRTPDYMLCSAQDYRRGIGGDQQHIWQATLGPNAVCFTTHPARRQGPTPNYWGGSGILPRVAQIKNVLIAIYRFKTGKSFYVSNELDFTHAWLPRDQFEEIVEDDGWIFARYGEGYLAMFSQHPYFWQDLPGEDRYREVITPGNENIWVVELGRRAVDGDFQDFCQRITQAPLYFNKSSVSYQSPSIGLVEFSWNGKLLLDKQQIFINQYPRYASPYVQASFPPEKIEIAVQEDHLNLEWISPNRQTSAFLE